MNFEDLPNDIIIKIFLINHQSYMKDILQEMKEKHFYLEPFTDRGTLFRLYQQQSNTYQECYEFSAQIRGPEYMRVHKIFENILC